MASLFYGMLALALALGMGVHASCHRGRGLAFGTRTHGIKAVQFTALQPVNATLLHPTGGSQRWCTAVCSRSPCGPFVAPSSSLRPFQVLLATIPLSLVLMFPEGIIHQNRQLELALLLYASLYVSIRVFPGFARRYITLASLGRKFLGNTLRISWAFPIFLLWSMGQLSSYIVQQALGEDIALNIAFEKQLFESLISAGSSPETSFLNLLTALAVMPMAAFTTLAVLGGGAGQPPSWMKPSEGRSADDTQEQLDMLSAGLDQLSAEVNESKVAPPQPHTPAVVQHVVVPVMATRENLQHWLRIPLPSSTTWILRDSLRGSKTDRSNPHLRPPLTTTPSFKDLTWNLAMMLDFRLHGRLIERRPSYAPSCSQGC